MKKYRMCKADYQTSFYSNKGAWDLSDLMAVFTLPSALADVYLALLKCRRGNIAYLGCLRVSGLILLMNSMKHCQTADWLLQTKMYFSLLCAVQWRIRPSAFSVLSHSQRDWSAQDFSPVFLVDVARREKLIFTLFPKHPLASDTHQFHSHFNEQSGSHSHFCFQVNEEVSEYRGEWECLWLKELDICRPRCWWQCGYGLSRKLIGKAREERGLGKCICSFVPAFGKWEQPICIYITL